MRNKSIKEHIQHCTSVPSRVQYCPQNKYSYNFCSAKTHKMQQSNQKSIIVEFDPSPISTARYYIKYDNDIQEYSPILNTSYKPPGGAVNIDEMMV